MRKHVVTLPRDDDGQLSAYAWPGGYPIFYATRDGLTICPKCANDPDTADPVTDADVNWEDPNMICEDCNERIPSAYAEEGNV